MTNYEAIRDSIEAAQAGGEYETAVAAASMLVEAGEPWLLEGLTHRAMLLEDWTQGPTDRLAAAANDWQQIVEIAPASMSHRRLAHVLLELGNRDAALLHLLEAERREATPEVFLGLARFHRTASPPEIGRAKAYYLRAALRGRTQGMRGYVETAYALDQPYAAAAMVLFGMVATPLSALVIGKQRHAGF